MNEQPQAPRRSLAARLGCLLAIISAVTGTLVLIVIVAAVALAWNRALAMRPEPQLQGEDEHPAMKEVWAYGQGEHKVVLIPLRGLIQLEESEGFFGTSLSSTSVALRSIRRATQDPDVVAIILDIDSGGGGITASDILYKALLDFRAAGDNRQIVAIFGDVAASGAYYIALAADHIIAHPTSITGSIGVLIQSLNLSELGRKMGIKDVTIASGENKALFNPLKDMTPEQLAILQTIVDAMHQRFVTLVAEHRGLDNDKVKALADGRIFTADQAVAAGLIDSIGYFDDARRLTAQRLEVEDIIIYRYEREFSLSSLLSASQSWQPAGLLERLGRTRLLYLWNL